MVAGSGEGRAGGHGSFKKGKEVGGKTRNNGRAAIKPESSHFKPHLPRKHTDSNMLRCQNRGALREIQIVITVFLLQSGKPMPACRSPQTPARL